MWELQSAIGQQCQAAEKRKPREAQRDDCERAQNARPPSAAPAGPSASVSLGPRGNFL
jgi:hypothetical protein